MRLTAFSASLLAMVTVVLFGPITVLAGQGAGKGQAGPHVRSLARLWEVVEVASIVGKHKQRREAKAGLVGVVEKGAAICPDWLAEALGIAECHLSAFASDSISLTTGVGPVSASFWVVVEGPGEVDGPEFMIMEGSLKGQIGLNPALFLGSISGRWEAKGTKDGPVDGLRVGGTFDGVVYLPFLAMPADGCTTGYRYTVACVFPEELSVGFTPLVRLDLEFGN